MASFSASSGGNSRPLRPSSINSAGPHLSTADNGHAAGHRFQHRTPQTFGAAIRLHQDIQLRDDAGHVVPEANKLHPATERRTRHPASQQIFILKTGLRDIGIASDDQEYCLWQLAQELSPRCREKCRAPSAG